MKKLTALILAFAMLTACASGKDASDETYGETTHSETIAETSEDTTDKTTDSDTSTETSEETTSDTSEETAAEETASEISETIPIDVPAESEIPEAGNSYGNIVNGGFAAYDGEWIYYNGFDNKCFYKMREDGTEKTKLADHYALDINIADGWIYYSYASDDGYYVDGDGFEHTDKYGIFKMRTDGSEETLLIDDWLACYVAFSDGWLYYRYDRDRFVKTDGNLDIITDEENSGIFKIRPDGSERTQVTSGSKIYNLNVVGDWIYYSTDNTCDLYKVRTDGSEKTIIFSEPGCDCINVAGDWIYYIGEENTDEYRRGIYKVRADGTDKTLLKYGVYFNLNAAGDWIYYNDWCDEGYTHPIYRMRLDGSEVTRLCDESANRINIVGDWIIYSAYGDDRSTYYYIMRPDGSEHRLLD